MFPGAAIAIAKDGRLLLAKGYGLANVEKQEPVKPDTLFGVASIAKPITAVAVLQLVEDDLLSLDDRVFQILHRFQPPEGADKDPRLDDITVRHLLEHSGGWDRDMIYDPMFNTGEVEGELGVPKPVSCSDVIRFMRGQPLNFDPGTEYAYSNFGYCLMGRIIEEKTGQPYEEYVKEQVLAPIGISRMPHRRHPAQKTGRTGRRPTTASPGKNGPIRLCPTHRHGFLGLTEASI